MKKSKHVGMSIARPRTVGLARKNTGITLIALIITIIVMLILVAVSISIALNTGLFESAGKATVEQRGAMVDEKISLWKTNVMMDNITASTTAESKDAIIDRLVDEDLLTMEEATKLRNNETIHIGSYEISLEIRTGKTISELYDGINDSNNLNYNENSMHIGDYVNYDAGVWATTKISSDTSWMGGAIEGASKNENADMLAEVSRLFYPIDYVGDYSGWRIWDISEEEEKVTLISGGCPEYFTYRGSEFNEHKYDAEVMLTGSTTGTTNLENYEIRDWSIYVNEEYNATNARTITKNDIDFWYNKYIDNTIEDTDGVIFPLNEDNKLISMLDNDFGYWVATPGSGFNCFYSIHPERRMLESNYICPDLQSYSMGLRILVTLTNPTFEIDEEKIASDGFNYNKWELK